MSLPEVSAEATIDDDYSVTVPAAIRSALDIEPGDTVRWTLTDDGSLQVSVVDQSYGALSELESVDAGTETNAVDLEHQFGAPEEK